VSGRRCAPGPVLGSGQGGALPEGLVRLAQPVPARLLVEAKSRSFSASGGPNPFRRASLR
jgi:hypothetical protein